MSLPKEIQNLILTRYYFCQWKEKIEKINQRIQDRISNITNRNINNAFDTYTAHKPIQNIWNNKWVSPLPKLYFFSSGWPKPARSLDDMIIWQVGSQYINIYQYPK